MTKGTVCINNYSLSRNEVTIFPAYTECFSSRCSETVVILHNTHSEKKMNNRDYGNQHHMRKDKNTFQYSFFLLHPESSFPSYFEKCQTGMESQMRYSRDPKNIHE